jgi:general secretion pathway protein I
VCRSLGRAADVRPGQERRIPGGGAGRRRRAERGFTLVEALAAIVVLALSLSALLSAHDTGLRGVSSIDEHMRARLLAQSLLAEWSQDRVARAPGEGRSGHFAWRVSMAPYAGAGGDTRAAGRDAAQDATRGAGRWVLHEVTVTVAWAPARKVALSTLRLMSPR